MKEYRVTFTVQFHRDPDDADAKARIHDAMRALKASLITTAAKVTPLAPPTTWPLTCHQCRHQQHRKGPCIACGAPAERVYL